MKRVIKYLQDQAIEASQNQHNGTLYLSPRTKEPQQRSKRDSTTNRKSQTHAYVASPPPYAEIPSRTDPILTPSLHHSETIKQSPLINKLASQITRHQYASDNILQSYDVYIPPKTSSSCNPTPVPACWLIYIHGGYFRDPAITSTSFLPTLAYLGATPQTRHSPFAKHRSSSTLAPGADVDITQRVAGYASLNYRLAPHPEIPQGEKTPDYERRSARWPEPLADVVSGIAHLQGRYGFGENYLLVGHGVGATLALLAVLSRGDTRRIARRELPEIPIPKGVLGVCGIYDFARLHEVFPGHEELTRNALPDANEWAVASPARYSPQDFDAAWMSEGCDGAPGRVLVIAQSRDDGMVDWGQGEGLMDVAGAMRSRGVVVEMLELNGSHDQVWSEGREIGRAMRYAVGQISSRGHA